MEILDIPRRMKVDKFPGPDQIKPKTLWEAKEGQDLHNEWWGPEECTRAQMYRSWKVT